MLTEESNITLQENTLFSKCQLWELQKDFFRREDIQAWANQVPFYITSNPYIAHSYAQVITRFMQDCQQRTNYQPGSTFYIVELGAGTGQFSFYMLKHLLELQQTLQLTQFKFAYVMTDFNGQLIQYWQQQPALQDFINKGVLDFAVYNAETEQTLKLVNANIVLQKSTVLANPLIVIANYVFDSITHDIFHIANRRLHETFATLTVPASDIENNKVTQMNNIDVYLDYRPTLNHYYTEPAFNQVLNTYLQRYKTAYFTFPIGALQCIKQLRELSGNNLLLLTSDKGYADTMDIYINDEPTIDFHGSFSLMVNFDAIGRYAKDNGGDYYFQTTKQQLSTCVYLFGNQLANFPETRQALKTYIEHSSPGNVFSIYQFIKQKRSYCSLDTILPILNITYWDPHIFNVCLNAIVDSIDNANAINRQMLANCLPMMAANYYHIPLAANTLANIGWVYQNLDYHEQALHYYQQSLNYFKPTTAVNLNMGICYYNLQNYQAAAEMFMQVLAVEPTHIIASGWLVQSLNHSKEQLASVN